MFRAVVFLFAILLLYAIAIIASLRFGSEVSKTGSFILISSSIALVTGILAIYKDSISRYIFRPSLLVQFVPFRKPDWYIISSMHKSGLVEESVKIVLRFRVTNIGNMNADKVTVFIGDVRVLKDGVVCREDNFSLMKLKWSCPVGREIGIPCGAYAICNLGYAHFPAESLDSDGTVLLNIAAEDEVEGLVTVLPPGHYIFRLYIMGSNVATKTSDIEFEWGGQKEELLQLFEG